MNKRWLLLIMLFLLPADVSASVRVRQVCAEYKSAGIEVYGAAEDVKFRISTSPNGIYADWTGRVRQKTEAEYEIKGLSAGRSYYIKTVNGEKASRPCLIVTAPKGKIRQVKQTGAGKKYISVSWEPVAQADAYRISAADISGQLFGEHIVKTQTARVKLPRQGEKYRLRIVPLKAGRSFYAEGKRYESRLRFGTLPKKIKKVTIDRFVCGSGKLSLGWEEDAGAGIYETEICDSAGKKLLDTESRRAGVKIRNRILKAGAFYGVRVRGTVKLASGRACGKWSDRKWFCGDAENVKLIRSGGIRITWKKVKGADGYRILVSGKRPEKLSEMRSVKTVRKNNFILKSYKGKAVGTGKYYICIAAIKRQKGKTFTAAPEHFYYLG